MKLWINTNISDYEHKLAYKDFTKNCNFNTSIYRKKVPDDDQIVDLLDGCAIERRQIDNRGNFDRVLCQDSQVFKNQVKNKLTVADILWENPLIFSLIG